jgi:hypothetical protein
MPCRRNKITHFARIQQRNQVTRLARFLGVLFFLSAARWMGPVCARDHVPQKTQLPPAVPAVGPSPGWGEGAPLDKGD